MLLPFKECKAELRGSNKTKQFVAAFNEAENHEDSVDPVKDLLGDFDAVRLLDPIHACECVRRYGDGAGSGGRDRP